MATGLLIALAAPALARDPFDPVITSQDVADSGTTTSTVTDGQPAVIGVPADVMSETVPTTGADTSSWLVAAYALIVMGGVAVIVSRNLRPARLQARPR